MGRPRSTKPTFSLIKRGNYYYVQFWFDDRAIRKSTGCISHDRAEAFLRKFANGFDPAAWRQTAAAKPNVDGLRPLTDAQWLELTIRQDDSIVAALIRSIENQCYDQETLVDLLIDAVAVLSDISSTPRMARADTEAAVDTLCAKIRAEANNRKRR